MKVSHTKYQQNLWHWYTLKIPLMGLRELFVLLKLWINMAENLNFQVMSDEINHIDFNRIKEMVYGKLGKIHLWIYAHWLI
jgi:hypothetical protein